MPAALPMAPQPAPIYPVKQYPSVWNGDHVLSGSEREWAAEDAAQHALNLANWRIKLLQVEYSALVKRFVSNVWIQALVSL